MAELKIWLLNATAGPPGDPDDLDPNNSDRERPERPERRRREDRHRHSVAPSFRGRYTPTITNLLSKSNNKWPDVKDFHGNKEDRDTWESWRM